jgi:antirestriction protein ArdC
MTNDEKVTVYPVLPRNIYGRAYRGINLWLLTAMGYESPYWLTFKQAEKLGGTVKKGEKGTIVVLWQPFEKMVTDDDGKTTKKRWLTLRYYRVFNVAQTTGCKFPKKVQESLDGAAIVAAPVDPFEAIDAADAIFEGWTGKPTVAFDGNDRAYYVPSEDIIHLPRKAQFRGSGEYYSTLFHELAHSTGHKSRLNRPILNAFGSHDYGVEELTAEFAAAFLNGMAGLDPAVIENNAAYIASWKKAIAADPKMVVTAAGRAQKAADLILGTAVEAEDMGVDEAEQAA